ncbi:MAG: hypothetical protein IJU21_03015, partial [Bacteroidales bacterium]|nr:hypothetical protein [Bacteroidales bacterium]
MIQSMTGYGKAEAILEGGKLTVEIRSLNSKSADINIKSSLLPKDKDIEVRKLLADRLVRGTIDLFLNWEPAAGGASAHSINADAFHEYWHSVVKAMDAETILTRTFLKDPGVGSILTTAILRLPDVVDAKKADVITPENWPLVEKAIGEALDHICAYRATEGKALYADVTSRVDNILNLYGQVENLEGERITAVREKFGKAMKDLEVKADPSRFEQEM